MRALLLIVALLVPAPLAAQQVSSLIAPVSPADLDGVRAAVPSICTTPPSPDAMTATAGVGTPCTPREDAAKQTPIPPASATTVSGGGFSGTWGMTLANPPQRAIATVEGATPYHCQIITKTATAFTGKCWLVNTAATLPGLATSLLGYSIPLLVDSTAGIAVTVLARQ